MNKAVRTQHLPVWLYLLASFGMELIWLAIFGKKNVGLIKERMHPGPGAKDGVRSIYLFYFPQWVGLYLVAWLDRTRFHWSDRVPLAAQIIGLIGVAVSTAILLWAMTVNPFFSSVIRIQRERGHRVITSGPYQYIRHPGYISGIGLVLFSSLALSSWLSLIPAALSLPFVLHRTIVEDKVLQEELPGYKEYAKKVPYRLIPGVW